MPPPAVTLRLRVLVGGRYRPHSVWSWGSVVPTLQLPTVASRKCISACPLRVKQNPISCCSQRRLLWFASLPGGQCGVFSVRLLATVRTSYKNDFHYFSFNVVKFRVCLRCWHSIYLQICVQIQNILTFVSETSYQYICSSYMLNHKVTAEVLSTSCKRVRYSKHWQESKEINDCS